MSIMALIWKRIAMMNLLLAAIIASTTLPLNDLGPAEYRFGYFGGLWADGSNQIPPDHAAAGLEMAARVIPRDAAGRPDPSGKIGLMAVGYGNTARTFEQFRSLAASDPRIHRNALVLVNAAAPRLDATQWEAPWSIAHARVATEVLPSAGLTAAQVQVAWIQLITEFPYTPLGIQIADAYYLKSSIAGTLIALKNRFPNLQIAYLSSSEFGGYGTSKYNPEPFAYEGGLSVRWVLLAQIDYARQGYTLEPRMVDINYEDAKAPWARWGPYLWADGATPRSDGLTWQREDFEADGETLSPIGARKSAQELLRFLLAEPTAAHWFRRDDVPARRRAARR